MCSAGGRDSILGTCYDWATRKRKAPAATPKECGDDGAEGGQPKGWRYKERRADRNVRATLLVAEGYQGVDAGGAAGGEPGGGQGDGKQEGGDGANDEWVDGGDAVEKITH